MKNLISLSLLIFSVALGCSGERKKPVSNKTAVEKIDSTTVEVSSLEIDTTTLEGKRAYIFKENSNQVSITFDTLLDLNYDKNDDYVIGYYAGAGTGLKNRISVYLFDNQRNRYALEEHLSNVMNPTFYLEKKTITGFYIGAGSGEGERLEWIGSKWVQTKTFSVANKNEAKSKWEISYPLTGKREVISMPYQMVPPKSILETIVGY